MTDREIIKALSKSLTIAEELIKHQREEIEMLNEHLKTMYTTRSYSAETIRAEAIKEFAEKLISNYATLSLTSEISVDAVGCDIKRLVKEMTGESNA